MTERETLTDPAAYKRTFHRRRLGYLRAGDRFIETAPHEAPARFRHPYTAPEWLALTVEERRAQHRRNAKEFITAQLGPAPGPIKGKTITLSELERLVIQRADDHAADLRFILSGPTDRVEAIIAGELPALRARVFDDLTARYSILEG